MTIVPPAKMVGTLGVAVLLAALTWMPAPTWAQADTAGAFNGSVDEALAHRKAGRHDQALKALARALSAIRDRSGPQADVARSRVRYYQSLSLVVLKRFEDARAVLVLLKDAPGLSAEERATVVARLGEVEAALAEAKRNRPGTVLVIAMDADGREVAAQARVDGEPRGTTPLKLTLPPGEHSVSVSAPAIADTSQVFLLPPGVDLRLVVRTKRRALPQEASFDPPAGAWVVAGSGLALVAGAIGLYVAAGADLDAYRDPASTRRQAIDAYDAAVVKNDASVALFIGGGALLVGGITWLLLDGWPEPSKASVSVSVHGRGLGLSGTF